MGLLLSLFGCKQSKKAESKGIYPKEEFPVLDAKLEDGKPAVGSFNLTNKNYDYKSNYPWCLKIAFG